MDETEWQEQKSRRNRKSNSTSETKAPSTKSSNRNNSASYFSKDKKYEVVSFEKLKIKKPNINWWLMFCADGNIEKLIAEKLQDLNYEISGKINSLWDCLFDQYCKSPNSNENINSGSAMKNDIYETDDKNFSENDALIKLCSKYKLQIRISSICNNLKDIEYNQYNASLCISLLHIGFAYFIPLTEANGNRTYQFSNEDRKLLSELSTSISVKYSNKQKGEKRKLEEEHKNLDRIRKLLQGKEQKDENYNPQQDQKKKKLMYDIHTEEQIDAMKDLILCKLKLTNAHSGIARPLQRTTNMNFNEIKLTSRRNCGYNAFENDTVYVKIIDKKNQTGKVMGVYESDHRPVNNIYICKVSRDQGSLMIPLDKSIPKIHVDNEPGRRHYESQLPAKRKQHGSVHEQQKSVTDREMESANYADNIYYSIFKIEMQKHEDRPTLKLLDVKEFNPETCEHFFIVYYHYWDPHFMYPGGKIVGILSSSESFNDSFPLISSICNIETLDINKTYLNEVSRIEKQVKSIPHVPGEYLPIGTMVFTIDNESTTDMDDAISYHKDENNTVIGVHISDVTKYISSTHEIYRQAKSRFCTFYPPSFSNIPKIHLLDKKLASDVLSLVPDKPRAVLSVFFKFNEEMFKNNFKLSDINYPTFGEGIIVSKHKLNYNNVSHWLKQSTIPQDVNNDLFIALIETYKIAKHLRRARLPESYFVRPVNNYYEDFKIENSFEAESLIEEFMLLANEYVARKIYEKYPDFTLLRIQNEVTNYQNWLEHLFKSTNMNFAGILREYCGLLGSRINNLAEKKHLIVSRKFYDKFCEYLGTDIEKAKNLLQYDAFYNDFYIHITEWYSISGTACYQCSLEDSSSNAHFSLNKSLYTHFTSPIRRFTDIVVHRLLKSVINGSDIDNSLDIKEVCLIANRKSKNNKTFEKFCAPFEMFEETKKTCFILDCVCSEIKNDELHVAHPLLQKAFCTKDIKFAKMDLDTAPLQLKIGEEVDNCTLKWKKIIYSYKSGANTSASNKFVVDNHIFDSRLPPSYYKIFREIRRSYQPVEKHKNDLNLLKAGFKNSEYRQTVSSDSMSLFNPIINIELNIYIKNTMRIQFCKYKVNGLQKINPELLIITPTFQICLIHRSDPVRYFFQDGRLDLKHNSIKKTFKSIVEYKEYFIPLIRIEALEETLSENSAFSLLSVPIRWIIGKSSKASHPERYGIIKLHYKFCKYRNIIFNDETDIIVDRLDYLISKGVSGVGGDLLCLRHKKNNCNYHWVGHGEILFVGKLESGSEQFKVIIFMITHSDFDIFTTNTEEDQFDIDVYLKTVVSKRQEEAVNRIEMHPLLKDVILGTNAIIKRNESDGIFEEIKNIIESKKIIKLNEYQSKAMENAMNHKLSFIWGPPGTGKTQIGCILSYAFSIKNSRSTGGVVLYCGPSNDCVNLVASEMKSKYARDCPKLLRIYGNQQELADFPLPGYIVKNSSKLTGEMQEISLHYLIRNPNNPHSESLRKFDMEFARIFNNECPNFNRDYDTTEGIRQVIHEKILAYKETLKEAKIEFIKSNNFEMVLCTTQVTATKTMSYFEIKQIIIDEAGMCKEPETLIPIKRAEDTVENVVLIGDHKQLRPVIRSKIANKRGLQISLFERYQQLKPELVTLLNFQYRMHPSICEFPSIEFYNSRLKTQVSHLWAGLKSDDMRNDKRYCDWNGIDYRFAKPYYKNILRQSNYNAIPNGRWPQRSMLLMHPYKCFFHNFQYYPERLIFVDVIGDEITQSVTTSLGNENSRANQLEVDVVEYIYDKLIHNLNPPRQAPAYVTILTQYKLQKHFLYERCKRVLEKKKIIKDPLVNTVIRSQGSENDYIIFSTVRSLRNDEDINTNPTPGWEKQYLGYICDPNQLNVALTRARKGLIIVGNKKLLRVNQVWKRLIENLEERRCVIENYVDFFNFV